MRTAEDLWMAKVADVEGYPEIASNFRETQKARPATRTDFDYLKVAGDYATGLPIGRHRAEP